MTTPTLPVLLRNIRKALTREDYAEAEKLYEAVLTFEEVADDLDLRIRYAYCTDKNGNCDQAIDAYQEVLTIYKSQGEESAAASVQAMIDAVRQRMVKEEEEQLPEVEEAVASYEPIDDATLLKKLCDMGELIHLAPGESLCRLGEPPDTLWLLRQGKMTVHLPDYEEADTIESREGHLTLVGELGFFTGQRRSADVEAESDAELFAIDTDAIGRERKSNPAFDEAMERVLYERWAAPVLTHHAVFERVNDIDRFKLMKQFKPVSAGPGETVVEAGKDHPYAYLLQRGCMFFMHSPGSVDDSVESDDGSLMTSIFPGDMIHLGGLLEEFKSEYRVVTATPVRLLRLSREDFEPFTLRRPWIIQAIIRHSARPVHLQVMRPEDDYLWKADRHIKTGL